MRPRLPALAALSGPPARRPRRFSVFCLVEPRRAVCSLAQDLLTARVRRPSEHLLAMGECAKSYKSVGGPPARPPPPHPERECSWARDRAERLLCCWQGGRLRRFWLGYLAFPGHLPRAGLIRRARFVLLKLWVAPLRVRRSRQCACVSRMSLGEALTSCCVGVCSSPVWSSVNGGMSHLLPSGGQMLGHVQGQM